MLEIWDEKLSEYAEIICKYRIEFIKKLNNKINNQTVISESEYKRVVKKVSDVKKWSKEQIADIIDNVQVDNEDNIYINYKYAIMEMA